MRELDTIQQENKVNDVFAMDNLGPGGAHHIYHIRPHGKDAAGDTICFQKGPRNDPNCKPGVTDADLLEIVRDRLKCFQIGPYSCHETAIALLHVEVALEALDRRQLGRAERGVLGTDAV